MSEVVPDEFTSEKLVAVTLQLPESVRECFVRLAGLMGTKLEDFIRDEVLRTYLEIFEIKNLEDYFSSIILEAEMALKQLEKQSKERERT
ncbi:MAG: hypothetical protein ACFE9L_00155 [Candidatus Hodarchaeota archaeon]